MLLDRNLITRTLQNSLVVGEQVKLELDAFFQLLTESLNRVRDIVAVRSLACLMPHMPWEYSSLTFPDNEYE